MRPKSWLLVGLLSASCIVPDVEVVPDSDDDTPGSSGKASTATGGSTTGPAPAEKFAFGKFCNGLSYDLELTLSIGTGSQAVEISAASGECTPISGEACTPMPVGINVPLTLLDGGEPIITYPVDIAEGVYWIFLAYENGDDIEVAGDPVTQDVCELGYDAPTPAGG
jgi:hypothetical protein